MFFSFQDEPYSPSRPVTPQNPPIPALANIVIPSNLQDILASIKNVPTVASVKEDIFPSASTISPHTSSIPLPPQPPVISLSVSNDEEYSPSPTAGSSIYSAVYEPGKTSIQKDSQLSSISSTHSSKLAKLSEAELLSMVPDDVILSSPSSKATDVSNIDPQNITTHSVNKNVLEDVEPPPPGLEDEYMPI